MAGAVATSDGAVARPAAPLAPLIHRYVGYRYSGFAPGSALHLHLTNCPPKCAASLNEGKVRVVEVTGY
jgi:hypothetical protein